MAPPDWRDDAANASLRNARAVYLIVTPPFGFHHSLAIHAPDRRFPTGPETCARQDTLYYLLVASC